jgi:hypothetical protein
MVILIKKTNQLHEHDILKWKITTKMGIMSKNLLDYGHGDFG